MMATRVKTSMASQWLTKASDSGRTWIDAQEAPFRLSGELGKIAARFVLPRRACRCFLPCSIMARGAWRDSTEREFITWWQSQPKIPARASTGWPILSAPGCDRRGTLAGTGTVWFSGSGIRACLDCFISGREGREVHLSKGVA